jgi:UPF0042 nucleotide-binding protein
MSGAGKTSALRAFEDLGYYCLDNLPPTLIGAFLQLYRQASLAGPGVAVVCDVRSGSLFSNFREAVHLLEDQGYPPEIVFIDCADEQLVTRFREARRAHPMDTGLHVERAVLSEREQMNPLKELATHIIDTTDLPAQTLRSRILALYAAGEPKSQVRVTLLSFGFKYGAPPDADFIFDTRFLPNPFYVEDLRLLPGSEPQVVEYVMRGILAQEYVTRVRDMLKEVLPHYVDVQKMFALVGIGCTGGRHRSVVVANRLAVELEAAGMHCSVEHRDLNKL